LVPLSRKDLQKNPEAIAILAEGADVIINLAGAPIIQRWTKSYKKLLFESRIETTRKLAMALAMMKKKPTVFISASAVGIYPEGGPYTEETSALDQGFLGSLCQMWELEAKTAQKHCRLVIFRIGIVLDAKGGALPKMLPAFKLGMGGKIASGKQGFSWIHIADLVNAFDFVINNDNANGVVNLTAPEPLSNAEFTKILARVMKRPALFPVPSFILKLLYGEAAITLTSGQLVLPGKLKSMGFLFRFPSLEPALNDLLRPNS
jgi:uncharacterized protein (TIGR01777 family)